MYHKQNANTCWVSVAYLPVKQYLSDNQKIYTLIGERTGWFKAQLDGWAPV